jgi:hypothetical protein
VRLEDSAASTLLSIFKAGSNNVSGAEILLNQVMGKTNGEVALTALQKLQLKRT